jgi:hypothetical protein
MSIYFLANNIDVINLINEISFTEDDLLVTFNHCQHLFNLTKIYNHKNKYHFIGVGKNIMHCDKNLINYLKNCISICFIGLKYDNIVDKFISNNNLKNCIFVDISKEIEIKNELIRNNFSVEQNSQTGLVLNSNIAQTGLLSFLYLKHKYNNFKNVKKYLFGFTNDYSNVKQTLWRGHSKKQEQEFYKNELIIDNNLVKIDK